MDSEKASGQEQRATGYQQHGLKRQRGPQQAGYLSVVLQACGQVLMGVGRPSEPLLVLLRYNQTHHSLGHR